MGISFCFENKEKKDGFKTVKRVKEYEDKHIKIKHEIIEESVNGRKTNYTDNKYIYNKDNYYKPQFLLGSGEV